MMQTEWAAAAMKLLIWGALMGADIDLPPARYDHPYNGPVRYVYDFPYTTEDGDFMWGYTIPPKRKGGVCVIHLSPIGSVVENQVMTEESLRILIRHEWGHCSGWRHREEAFTLIGRDDPFIVGPENPPPWPRPPSVPPQAQSDRPVEEPDAFITPPGRLCPYGGAAAGCEARPGWHLEEDQIYGDTVAIKDNANPRMRLRNIDTEREWGLLSGNEMASIISGEHNIYDFVRVSYDEDCLRRYHDALRCRSTGVRRMPVVGKSIGVRE